MLVVLTIECWFQPVWPDVEIKSCPKFFQKLPKNSLTSLASKAMVFTTAQNVTKHLGYFCNKICYQYIPKIVQSGHTDFNEKSWCLSTESINKRIWEKFKLPWAQFCAKPFAEIILLPALQSWLKFHDPYFINFSKAM